MELRKILLKLKKILLKLKKSMEVKEVKGQMTGGRSKGSKE